MECLCLCLYFTCTKLRHYLFNAETHVVCKADIIKQMLSAPIRKGRLGKWMYALSEFDIRFQPAKAVKGQALADLITKRESPSARFANVRPWVMFFDGSTCDPVCGIGIHIISPRGVVYEFAFRLVSKLTNNQTKYEAIYKGLELLLDAGAEVIQIFSDSKDVIHQLTEDYDCVSDNLHPYFVKCHHLMARFCQVTLTWLPREWNVEANRLA
jgi:ribonuclease HI